MDLNTAFERVCDRATFLEFVEAVIREREKSVEAERGAVNPAPYLAPDSEGWYNTTIEGYLETAHAWTKDVQRATPEAFPEEPEWKVFAAFLYMGKVYE